MNITKIELVGNLVALTVVGETEQRFTQKGHCIPIFSNSDADKVTIKNLESRDLFAASVTALIASSDGVTDKAELKTFLGDVL